MLTVLANYLFSTYHVPGTLISDSYLLSHVTLTTVLRVKYCCYLRCPQEKLKHEEMNSLAFGYSKWQCWTVSPCAPSSILPLSHLRYYYFFIK